MAKLEAKLAALTTMSSAQLREEWQLHHDGEAPPVADHILKQLLAYRFQEHRYGGLPAAVLRELKRPPGDPAPTTKSTIKIGPGARLVREWNGQTIAVEALEKGFQWNDRHYSSLTAIASEVTGAHWSGPRFFGLTNRG